MIKARTVKAYGVVHHTAAVHTPLYRSSSFSLGDSALRIPPASNQIFADLGTNISCVFGAAKPVPEYPRPQEWRGGLTERLCSVFVRCPPLFVKTRDDPRPANQKPYRTYIEKTLKPQTTHAYLLFHPRQMLNVSRICRQLLCEAGA